MSKEDKRIWGKKKINGAVYRADQTPQWFSIVDAFQFDFYSHPIAMQFSS